MSEPTKPLPPRKKKGWDCDEDGCTKTVQDGPLFRVNPKGQPGIFMCREHEEATWPR